MAVKVDSYKWFKYDGRALMFPTSHPDHALSLSKGEIFGYKKIKDKHYVIDKSNPEIRFEMKETDAERILKVSEGWSGQVRRVPVKAGVGGRDKPPVSTQNTKELYFLEIDSSNLLSAVYNKKEKILYVNFKTRPYAIYAYPDVSMRLVKGLEEAPSQGRYFIYRIRDVKSFYRVSRMPTPDDPATEIQQEAPKEKKPKTPKPAAVPEKKPRTRR